MVRQDKNKPGRITPKGVASRPSEADESAAAGRVPVKVDRRGSVVPIVMFGSLILGGVIIMVNYLTEGILGTPSNWYLFAGLGLVLVGIVAATQYE